MRIKEIDGLFDIERIVPYFQPIMDLQHHAVWSYECLARLVTDDERTFLPSEFLYLVERHQCFGELSQRIFYRCASYFRNNNMAFSINISQQDIVEPAFAKFLAEFLDDYPVPSRVTLELMASTAFDCRDDFMSFLAICKRLNIKLFVDHFGAISSNITSILDLPIDGVKVDGALIRQMVNSQETLDFVGHLNQLADERGIAVIAEHIEDKSALDAVQGMGIRYGQGFYFSRPQASLS